MKILSYILGLSLVLSFASARAQLIDNGLFTTDTRTGLDWLDLTETTYLSYNRVTQELLPNGRFAGWQVASSAQVASLFDSAGGNGVYDGWSRANNGVADRLLPLWGDTQRNNSSYFRMADEFLPGYRLTGLIFDTRTNSRSAQQDLVDLSYTRSNDSASNNYATALVRVSAVPVPPALLLFSSALLGLLPFLRGNKQQVR